MNIKHLLGIFCAPAILIMVAGCGAKYPATAPVVGVVTYNGSPLDGAQITFFGEQGRPATGVADGQGRFRLMTFAPGDGALPGEYAVVITKSEQGSADPNNPYAPVRSLIPVRYGDRSKSGLNATVYPGKTNEFTFELTN